MVDAIHAGGDVGGLGYDMALSTVFMRAGTTPVCATLIYHIPVTAHKPHICTPGTAHHPNFSHMLVLLLGSLGVYILY